MRRSDFQFDLPESLIAQHPPKNRGDSRLLCLNGITGALLDRHFLDLPSLLRPGDLMVFNNTRVMPARLFGRKASGGRVEILVERIQENNTALAHLRASKTPKTGTRIALDNSDVEVQVLGREGDLFKVLFATPTPVLQLLQSIGHIPLPPYINRDDAPDDHRRYQTVYASRDGAVAAPTAGLHFTDAMLLSIRELGIAMQYVTLHVGAGTFQPVRVDNLREHHMHHEYVQVSQPVCDAVRRTRELGGRVIAVGDHFVARIEAASQSGELAAFDGETDIFIYPGVPVRSVDVLITNFHLPESTLLMLVSAFAGKDNIFKAYRHAVDNQYRFFSYGDAMFIEKQIQS